MTIVPTHEENWAQMVALQDQLNETCRKLTFIMGDSRDRHEAEVARLTDLRDLIATATIVDARPVVRSDDDE